MPMTRVNDLRKAMGFSSQQKFADALGLFVQTIAAWEQKNRVPDNKIPLVVQLAKKRGCYDVARATFPEYFKKVKAMMSSRAPKSRALVSTAAEVAELEKALRLDDSQHPVDAAGENSRWHQLLDEILSSGDTDTIDAITQNLQVFARHTRTQKAISSQKAQSTSTPETESPAGDTE